MKEEGTAEEKRAVQERGEEKKRVKEEGAIQRKRGWKNRRVERDGGNQVVEGTTGKGKSR